MASYIDSPLLTDFYQLTMAYGYWKLGMHEQPACFHALYRKAPFKGNYALACGLEQVAAYLEKWRFSDEDLKYLASLKDASNKTIFPTKFLEYLRKLRFTCDMDAIPEGTVVFPNEPLLRIQGPLLQCQLLETPILTFMNFQTLVATKASRICRAAKGEPVIEFGMRRAQGPDGALSASRAAYIGGCVATSNVLAGKHFNIPVRGTHAHSWITAFSNEREAFDAYGNVMPRHCVFLVDTYNTLQGVKHAIESGKVLRKQGGDLSAIRLDSGDMAKLSIKARKMLDKAGFAKTHILASNSLDEHVIQSLKKQRATISMWGVGTQLATAYDQPALDGVYKLSALANRKGEWEPKLKLSEQPAKTSNPGRQQVRRFFSNEQYVMDVVYDIDLGISEIPEAVLMTTPRRRKKLNNIDGFVDLLQPIFKRGKRVQPEQNIHETRECAIASVAEFVEAHGTSKPYPVGLEKSLFDLKQKLVKKLK